MPFQMFGREALSFSLMAGTLITEGQLSPRTSQAKMSTVFGQAGWAGLLPFTSSQLGSVFTETSPSPSVGVSQPLQQGQGLC